MHGQDEMCRIDFKLIKTNKSQMLMQKTKKPLQFCIFCDYFNLVSIKSQQKQTTGRTNLPNSNVKDT